MDYAEEMNKERKDSSNLRKSQSSKEADKKGESDSLRAANWLITVPREGKERVKSPPDNQSIHETEDTAAEEFKNNFRGVSDVHEDMRGLSKNLMVWDYNGRQKDLFVVRSQAASEISAYSWGNARTEDPREANNLRCESKNISPDTKSKSEFLQRERSQY